jgi:hypothetical protein
MIETGTAGRFQEQAKEIVKTLIDSDLYLDMDLAERNRLLHYIMAAYFSAVAR